MVSSEQIVAHRGYQKYFPENTILAIVSAIDAGAKNIEVDIQLNDEGIAFLFHDDNLFRMSGVNRCFHSASTIDIGHLYAYEPERLGNKFAGNPISLFAELLPIIRNYKDVNFFIELKEESIERYGHEACINNLLVFLEEQYSNCVFISYSKKAVLFAKQQGFHKTGIVLHDWNDRDSLLKHTQADYVFVDVDQLKEDELIQASVPVVVFEVGTQQLANHLLSLGASAVETFALDEFFLDMEKSSAGAR